MCPDAASAEDLMRAEGRTMKSIKVCMMAVYHSVYEHKPWFKTTNSRIWYQRACLQIFIGSTVELMQIHCWMCPDAALAEDLMRAEGRHIKSITVCTSANCGSNQTIVAYDIREDVCNDSYDPQSISCSSEFKFSYNLTKQFTFLAKENYVLSHRLII